MIAVEEDSVLDFDNFDSGKKNKVVVVNMHLEMVELLEGIDLDTLALVVACTRKKSKQKKALAEHAVGRKNWLVPT